ncbi:hypothetical protein ABK040_000638 [Willaertia magna]
MPINDNQTDNISDDTGNSTSLNNRRKLLIAIIFLQLILYFYFQFQFRNNYSSSSTITSSTNEPNINKDNFLMKSINSIVDYINRKDILLVKIVSTIYFLNSPSVPLQNAKEKFTNTLTFNEQQFYKFLNIDNNKQIIRINNNNNEESNYFNKLRDSYLKDILMNEKKREFLMQLNRLKNEDILERQKNNFERLHISDILNVNIKENSIDLLNHHFENILNQLVVGNLKEGEYFKKLRLKALEEMSTIESISNVRNEKNEKLEKVEDLIDNETGHLKNNLIFNSIYFILASDPEMIDLWIQNLSNTFKKELKLINGKKLQNLIVELQFSTKNCNKDCKNNIILLTRFLQNFSSIQIIYKINQDTNEDLNFLIVNNFVSGLTKCNPKTCKEQFISGLLSILETQ